jgi:hypothetical protein
VWLILAYNIGQAMLMLPELLIFCASTCPSMPAQPEKRSLAEQAAPVCQWHAELPELELTIPSCP